MISDALSTVTALAAAAASSPDWPAIIAAIFAGLSGMVTLVFGLRARARQEETAHELALIRARAEAAAEHAADASQNALRTAQSVQESREERLCQIDGVRADLGRLRAEFQGGQQDGRRVFSFQFSVFSGVGWCRSAPGRGQPAAVHSVHSVHSANTVPVPVPVPTLKTEN